MQTALSGMEAYFFVAGLYVVPTSASHEMDVLLVACA